MAQRPILPARANKETIDTAAMLSRGVASAEEIVGGTRGLDEYSDTDQDDNGLELDGRTMMDMGKFKGQKTLAEVYTDDKGYIQWVRNHKKSGLLRLKTYVELRDVVKFNRVAARLVKKEKGTASGSSGGTPSRSRTKQGNQDHMELDMWERVEARSPTSTAPLWENMTAEMMIKDAEWQRNFANRSLRNAVRVRLLTTAALRASK